ncbi:MAG: T9SS type A sorting domain-containing protein [Bacteroidetes bacterium]|nr:T9SS type A sorting domain-containing protein [Bacteroidota bacterium]
MNAKNPGSTKKFKKVENKLKAYSATALALMAISPAANATIVYTDVNPDVTYSTSGSSHLLDLNNDNIDDFELRLNLWVYGSFSTAQVKITPLVFNAVDGYISNYWNLAALGQTNDTIDATKGWMGGGQVILAQHSSFGSNTNIGPWFGAKDKYLGLQILVSGNTYYGWARLDVDSNAKKFTLKDYAYEDVPLKSILAGDTGLVTYNEPTISDEELIVYSFANEVFVNIDKSFGRVRIRILNVEGREVYTGDLKDSNSKISLDISPAGVYFVQIDLNGTLHTKKVFIAGK